MLYYNCPEGERFFQESEVTKMWIFRDRISERIEVATSAREAEEMRNSGRYIFLRYW